MNSKKLYKKVFTNTGEYVKIFVGRHKTMNVEREIKQVSKKVLNSKLLKSDILAEFKALQGLDHPNIIKVFENYEDKENIYIICE